MLSFLPIWISQRMSMPYKYESIDQNAGGEQQLQSIALDEKLTSGRIVQSTWSLKSLRSAAQLSFIITIILLNLSFLVAVGMGYIEVAVITYESFPPPSESLPRDSIRGQRLIYNISVKFDTVRVFEPEQRWWASSSEADGAWDSLLWNQQAGVIYLQNTDRHGLLPGHPIHIPNFNVETYSLSMYHQLHCLVSISWVLFHCLVYSTFK